MKSELYVFWNKISSQHQLNFSSMYQLSTLSFTIDLKNTKYTKKFCFVFISQKNIVVNVFTEHLLLYHPKFKVLKILIKALLIKFLKVIKKSMVTY